MSRKRHEKTEDVEVKDLWFGCDDVKPRDTPWSDLSYDIWTVIQPYSSEDFKKFGDPWEHSDEAEEKLGYGSFETMEDSNQPMMNYHYPLGERDSFDEKDARAIRDLPLCLVYFNESEEYALALTGGGMDLSWSIVEAYIRLGYVPPIHFSKLPRFAGYKVDKRKRIIVEAIIKGLSANIAHSENRLKDLQKILAKEDGELI